MLAARGWARLVSVSASETPIARAVGINHLALGDVEEALDFYGRLFEIRLRGRSRHMAFIDLGDQFVAISEGREQAPDRDRHFGLVVDDKEKVRRAAGEAGATTSRSSSTTRSSSRRRST